MHTPSVSGILFVSAVLASIEIYITLKLLYYIGTLFPTRYKKYLAVLAVVFLLWTNSPLLSMLLFGRTTAPLPHWQLYGFVYPFYIWISSALIIFLLYLVLDIPLLVFKIIKKVYKVITRIIVNKNPGIRKNKSAAVDSDKRKFLKLGAAGLALIPVSAMSYGIVYGSRKIITKNVTIHFNHIPDSLRGLKIAQLSDIHCSDYVPKEKIAQAVSLINAEKPDIVFLTGDYVPMDVDYIYICIDALKALKAPFGIFASLGNHEEWTNARLITRVIERNDIPVLRNGGITITIKGEKINILGVDDSRWGHADLDSALAQVPNGHFTILMSHEPEYWDYAVTKGINLTLAGHTHGGQLALPFTHSEANLGRLFHKYNAGLYEKNELYLYVSTGVGFTGPPIRLNIPPEVVIITFQ
jgi:predicted MPP superfamily phosphohydrolase